MLKPGNKVKTAQVMANFAFGENSLGIRDDRMVVTSINIKQWIHKYVPEPAAIVALAHVPSRPAPTSPPAKAVAAATNVPLPAALPATAAAAHVSQPSPTLPPAVVANVHLFNLLWGVLLLL